MKKLGRKIKLNVSHFSQDASKSGFGDKKFYLDPSPNAGAWCYSVRVSVIAKTYKAQRISYLLWSEFLIITQTRFWKKSRVNLIYPNYRAVHLFSLTKISYFPIHKSKFREICKKWDCPPLSFIPIIYIHFFHSQIQISARFGINGCISV